jgi:hypothetical protein
MIGLSILAILFGYILLSKFIINKTYEKFGTKKAKYIATAIMILIPTWDVILGFPVYAYLCVTQAGVHIYKTIEDVEGFYIGERSIGSEPIEPYEGYKYIDYQEVKNNKLTGKYYRSYWVDYFKDREMANMCVYPSYPKSLHHPYTKAFNSGKCIVKEEIDESEVSGLWKVSKKVIDNYSILYLKITSISIEVRNPKTKEKLLIAKNYMVDNSWITGMNISSGKKSRMSCNGLYNYYGNEISQQFIINKLVQIKEK